LEETKALGEKAGKRESGSECDLSKNQRRLKDDQKNIRKTGQLLRVSSRETFESLNSKGFPMQENK
jgi:hypothetical protein